MCLRPDTFQDACIYSPAGIYVVGLSLYWQQNPCVRLLIRVSQTDEVQKRFAVFYGVGCVASALAGILAFGLTQMNGTRGIAGWRWIFILEGVVSRH